MSIWHIVQCNPNCEAKAVSEMRRAGFRAYLPKVASVRRHHRTNEPIVKRRPLLVGYVFMRFVGPVNWYTLRQCQGVKGVLYIDGRPYGMQREDVAAIMRAQRSMTHEDKDTRAVRREMRSSRLNDVKSASKQVARKRFAPGMSITAPMGAAERMLARIISITKKGTIKAIVSLGPGHEMPVEFTDLESLVIVDNHAEAA